MLDLLREFFNAWTRRKSCCEVHGFSCNQGRNCPARKGK